MTPAAAAISKGDPIKTGVQGFAYDIRTALLPFLFLFNTDLLLIDVGPLKAIFVFIIATAAMMLFAAATQGWFLTRSRIWESIALLLVAFTLFRPGFWLDMVSPPFDERPGSAALSLIAAQPENATIRLRLVGPDFDDPEAKTQTVMVVNLGKKGDGEERLANAGLNVLEEDGKVVFDGFAWNFKDRALKERFEKQFLTGEPDNPIVIDAVLTPRERMPKEVFYIPALLLLGFVVMLQRARARALPKPQQPHQPQEA